MAIDDRDWYRRKKRLEAGLDPNGGYLKGPEEQPRTPSYRKKPGDALVKAVNRKPMSRRQKRKAVKAMNQTRNPRSGRPIRHTNVAAWVWGTLCVSTVIMYALELQGILTFWEVLDEIIWAWNWVVDTAIMIFEIAYEWLQEKVG